MLLQVALLRKITFEGQIMKKMLAAVLSVLMVSSMAFAAPAQQLDIATMSKAESQFLFKADADITVLDKQEMVETEGKYGWWGALAGAATNVYGYLGYAMGSGSFSMSRLGIAALSGAAAGTILPTLTAIMWTAHSHATMFGGLISGIAGR